MLTEVDQPMATRMAEAASAALSRIDRIYVSALGWVIQQLRIYAHIDRPPDRMLADRLSDHSLVAVSWQRRSSEPARQRQRPQHVYKSAVFAEALVRLERDTCWHDLSPFAALHHHKSLMSEAARTAHTFLTSEPTESALSAALQAAARAVCNGEAGLLRALVRARHVCRRRW